MKKSKVLIVLILILLFLNRNYLVSQAVNLRATIITAYGAGSSLNAQTALTNAVIAQITAAAGRTTIYSTKSGSAGYQPLYINVNGSDQYQFTTAGNFAISNGTVISTNTGALTGLTFSSQTNCASSTGTCGSAPSGGFTITQGQGTATISTTAVTSNSNIVVTEDFSIGSRLGVNCNTTLGRTYTVSGKSSGTSFTVVANSNPVTFPACLVYQIIN